ncbi:MAG TPA: Gfo/Idh/MocA family oxidoreductase [Acidimicrobiales bacterium]|nr:Gfo/Idh/MocA family oxidoreductase [Acidimicrobiales bacterium]
MTTRRELTLGLAGAGWMAGVHAYAAAQIPGLHIAKVASRSPERAQATAERIGAQAVPFSEVADGVNGVIVSTPPAQHAAHALAAVAAGAAVLVEKPLCTTLDDADALVDAAEDGATIAYAENLLHAPVVRRALDHVGQLPGVDLLEVRALQGRPDWGSFLTVEWGGGALFDLGAHPLAVALALAAPARAVEVRASLEGAADHPVDEHADVHLAFDTGLLARLAVSWRQTGTPVWDAQVSSPDGVVRMELLPEVRLERNGVEVPLPPLPAGVAPQLEELGYLAQLEAFAVDVARGRHPAIGPVLGREVLDITCAAYWSAGLGGAWVELPFEGPRDQPPISLWRSRRRP